MTCARCGADNPDGNRFCQACGTPLTAAAAGIAAQPGPPGQPGQPGPPAPYPLAPPPVPAGYVSPYYVPRAGVTLAPVHRVPLMLIISAVVVLVLLMAGIGTAVAILGHHPTGQVGTGIASGQSSPSPGGLQSPPGPPVSAVATTATNQGLSVPVPPGWNVEDNNGESITLVDPSSEGAVTVASGLSNPARNAQQLRDSIDQALTAKYPDTRICPTSQATNGALNGAAGLYWSLCFTLTSGGQSTPAESSLFVGASPDGGVFYLVELVTIQDNLQTLVSEARPILAGITWKLP